MPVLWRALTKLREVRDIHMEKAINNSMPTGQSEEGKEGGRMSGDISNRGRYEEGGAQQLHKYYSFLIQSSGAE